jgi:undecaprenyl-diphosphatase
VGLIEAAILGLVQGITEFLPISSTAHIRIVPALFGWSDPGAAFTAAIQLGSLAAIVLYFWKDLVRAIRGWLVGLRDPALRSTPDYRLGWAVAIGTVPIVLCGLIFRREIETSLRSLYVIAWALLAVGLLMGAAELIGRKARKTEEVVARDGLMVGLFQALALIPGVSRSGSTITGALLLGFDRVDAARFSFLLSIPSILAAGIYSLYAHREALMGPDAAAVWTANAVSFVSGYLAIAFLIRFLQKHGTGPFIAYRLLLGAGMLVALSRGMLAP